MKKHTPKILGNAEFVGDFEAGTSDWHGARSEGIGGSEIGTILGLNPWESAFTLWHKKLGNISDELDENWMIRFGKAFEEPILKLFAEEHPELEIFTTGTYRNRELIFMHANPDAIARNRNTGEWVIIEIKFARSGWAEPPQHYRAQVNHYLSIFGWTTGYLVGVAGGEWEEHVIKADAFELSAQTAAAKRFWEYVLNETPPNWDGSKMTYELVRKLHPDIDGSDVDITDLAQELVDAKDAYDAAELRFNKIRSEVVDRMDKAKTGYAAIHGTPIKVATRQARGLGVPYLVIDKQASKNLKERNV